LDIAGKLLIVVLFGFLNIKSVKIYAIPYIFSTTLLLYKLDTLLLKQKNLPVLGITGFFPRRKKKLRTAIEWDYGIVPPSLIKGLPTDKNV
jgi:hypothetical protein